MSISYSDSRGESIALNTIWSCDKFEAYITLNDSNSQISKKIKYPLAITEEKEEYSSSKLFLFKNKFFSREDHCFRVIVNDNRCGVIFPIKVYSNATLLPSPTSDSNTKFFYRFLHIAYYHLFTDESLPSKAVEFQSLVSDELKVVDFYDEETVVFLYHDDKSTFNDIKTIYPSLFKYGYVPILSSSEYHDIEMVNLEHINEHPLYGFNFLNRLNLRTSTIISEKFIEQIFSSILKFHLTPLSKFVLLYQVIELLIDKIAYEHYQDNTLSISSISISLDEVNKEKSFRNIYSKLKIVNKKLENSVENIKTEEKRIDILINQKCDLNFMDYTDFTNYAQNLIGNNIHCNMLQEFIYNLRNKIIHDYHNATLEHADIDKVMNELNLEFEKLIADIIIKYK